MNKKIRDLLFILFIVLFISITTSLSIYAAGYRLDFKRILNGHVLQKTGTLILASTPKNADIYLDGKQAKSSGSIFGEYAVTPTKIKNLLPKEYDVKVELDGYWPFEKKITIYGGQSTYAENIILFKRCLATTAENLLAESYQINLDASVDVATTKLIEEKIGSTEKLKSADNSLFFFGDKKRISSYNQKNEEVREIIASKDQEEEILDFLPKNNYLYIVIKIGSRIELRNYELKNNTSTKVINLPGAWQYKLSSNENDIIAAYNPDSRNLFLFNKDSLGPIGGVINNVNYWKWISGEQLLVASDFEISTFDLKNNNHQLITRISEKISGLAWSAKQKYLIYTTNQSINTIDLFEGNGQITKLLDGKNISNPNIDEKNKILYFQTKNNDEVIWQKIEIQ